MCGSMADIQSATAEIRRGKKRGRRTNHSMKIYMVFLFHRATIKKRKFGRIAPSAAWKRSTSRPILQLPGHTRGKTIYLCGSVRQNKIAGFTSLQSIRYPFTCHGVVLLCCVQTRFIGSRPSDHYFRSVCWFVSLCRVFLSRL